MKISVDNQHLFTLTETQKKVIQNDIPVEIFIQDMKRRLKYIIEQPCVRFVEQNKPALLDELKRKNVTQVSSDHMKFADKYFEVSSDSLHPEEDRSISVHVDDQPLMQITPTHKKIWKRETKKEKVHDQMKEDLKWILTHKYERCMQRLRLEWEPKLASRGYDMLPVDNDAFAELVFAQSDYKNRTERDALAK